MSYYGLLDGRSGLWNSPANSFPLARCIVKPKGKKLHSFVRSLSPTRLERNRKPKQTKKRIVFFLSCFAITEWTSLFKKDKAVKDSFFLQMGNGLIPEKNFNFYSSGSYILRNPQPTSAQRQSPKINIVFGRHLRTL